MKMTKKVIITGIIAIMTLLMLAVTSKAATVKVTGEVLNIRKSASTSSEVIAMISEGVECELLGEEGDWYKIKYKKYTGYISKQYAKLVEENTTTEETTNTQTSENNSQSAENNNQTTENSNQTTNQTTENNNQSVESNEQQEESQVVQIQYQKLTKNSDVKILPLIHSSNIGTLKKDVEVILITKAGSWSYIQADEFNGWVRSDILAEGKTVTVGGSDENSAETAEERVGYINENYVNVRKGAGTSYSVIKVLSLNATVTIIGEEGDWYEIKSGSDTGFVSKQFVSNSKKTTSRSLETPRTANAQNNEETTVNSTIQNEKEEENKTNTSQTITDKTTSTESMQSSTSSSQTSNTQTTSSDLSSKEESTSSSQTSSKSEEASSSKGEEVVAYAKKFLGSRYVYGGDGANGTFDCSGFTMYVYKHFGISLPHGATSQSKVSSGTKITSQSKLQAGDIVFLTDYETGVGIGHCGIYIADGNFIHASTTTYTVTISSLNTTYAGRFYSAMRFF